MFDGHTSKIAGAKGGKQKTEDKRRAARANGAKGGRPSSRQLAERLLGRKISADEEPYLQKAWQNLLVGDRQELGQYFGVPIYELSRVVDTQIWKLRTRNVPRNIRHLIKRFKLEANHQLASQRKTKPKDYIVEYHEAPPERRHLWEIHQGSNIPCPPQKIRVFFRDLYAFSLFEDQYRMGIRLTDKDILGAGGAQWTPIRAKAALRWLASEYPQEPEPDKA